MMLKYDSGKSESLSDEKNSSESILNVIKYQNYK